MLIDKSHRTWMIITALAVGLSSGLYVIYVRSTTHGPTGGSWQGLLFGIAGSLLLVFAGLLAGRKRLPRWRLGSAQFWLRAHIWLGLLSVPLLLFHAGFRWGGLLEQVLLAVLALVVASGILGVIFQQYLPRLLKESTPREAMFEQIPHVCAALRATADGLVVAICGTLFPPLDDSLDTTTPPAAREAGTSQETLRDFYVTAVRPFLAAEYRRESPLHNVSRAAAIFAQIQQTLPAARGDVLSQLAAICDERRELARQVRLHRWLHLWLFVHVPLSLSLLVLGVAHAIASVYY